MKKFGLAAAALTGILITSFSAIPAQAVGGPVLPSNQNLFVLDCDSFGGNLWSVDPASGAATRVDAGTPVDRCGGGAQTNPIDGLTYFVYYHATTYLATADTTSGVISKVADFNGATDDPWSIAITNAGDAFAQSGSNLYTLDLETGTTVLVGGFGSLGLGASVQSIAYNPVDDTIYGFTRGLSTVYTINPETGAATVDSDHSIVVPADFITCVEGGTAAYQFNLSAFDANGNLWIQGDSCGNGELLSVDFETGVVTWLGQFADTAHTLYTTSPHDFYAVSIVITTDVVDTGNETLASTGPSTAAFGWLMGLGGTLLLSGFVARTFLRRHGANR